MVHLIKQNKQYCKVKKQYPKPKCKGTKLCGRVGFFDGLEECKFCKKVV